MPGEADCGVGGISIGCRLVDVLSTKRQEEEEEEEEESPITSMAFTTNMTSPAFLAIENKQGQRQIKNCTWDIQDNFLIWRKP